MSYNGYHFFIGDLELPYAPSELTVTIGSNNQTVSLINGSEINILKSPKLTEIKFDVELPRGRQYPFANKLISSITYTDYFKSLMITKSPTHLVITRPNPFLKGSTGIGGTIKDFESMDIIVSLEGYDIKEDAENGYDLKVSLTFKEYVKYGTIKTTVVNTTPITTTPKPAASNNKSYTVVKGDCLWKISKKFYGTGTKWRIIYNTNKTVIENTAKQHGKKSSSDGWWIYPGTKLIIPANS